MLEGKVNCYGIATLEVVLQEVNDEAANCRWKGLKAFVPLSDEFIKFVKTQLCQFNSNVPVAEENNILKGLAVCHVHHTIDS